MIKPPNPRTRKRAIPPELLPRYRSLEEVGLAALRASSRLDELRYERGVQVVAGYKAGLSYQEIAEATGLSRSNIVRLCYTPSEP